MMEKKDFKSNFDQNISECSFSSNDYSVFMNTQLTNNYNDKMLTYRNDANNIDIYQNNFNMNFMCYPKSQNIENVPITENSIKFNNSSNTSSQKNHFTLEEDEFLLHLVKSIGIRNWQKISLEMKKNNIERNGRQCRDRYIHYLDPNINKNSKWTPEEDSLLIKSTQKHGKKWKVMEKIFPGRTEVSLRNRYNLLMRKERKEHMKIEKKQQSKKDQKNNEFIYNTVLSNQMNENTFTDFNFDSLNDTTYESSFDKSFNDLNDFETFELF